MGNLISFPLLCLVNYLAFRWKMGRVPVKINGDDIVFRSTKDNANRWFESVARAGLTLSVGKTLVSPTYFSLNSTLFKSTYSKVSLMPFIRSTAFGYKSDCGGVGSLRGRFFSSFPGYFGDRRSKLRIEWLKRNRKWIDASRRSITRGLGIGATYDEMNHAGLWCREGWYLSLESEKALPPEFNQFEQQQMQGYRLHHVERLTKELRELQRGVAAAFIEAAWSPVTLKEGGSSYKELVNEGCGDYLAWHHQLDIRRRSRLLKISASNTRRYLRVSVSAVSSRMEQYKKRKKSVWLPVELRTSMKFLRSEE